ncbi:MAG: hypothetical protein QMD05_08870 [Candidatus Brocadiaceae bacterium]|nr:hypothetical protein [Candidatus Brocadiaceae bacterium]
MDETKEQVDSKESATPVTPATSTPDYEAEKKELEAKYTQALEQNAQLAQRINQVSLPATQPTTQSAPQPERAKYPSPELYSENPQAYSEQAQKWMEQTVADRVSAQIRSIQAETQGLTKVQGINKYLQGKYGEELGKGLNSELVKEATTIFAEMGITADPNTVEYKLAQQAALDRANAEIMSKKMTQEAKDAKDESARRSAADAGVPAQSTVRKGADGLPELDAEEIRINKRYGIAQEKLKKAKARLEVVE